MSHPPENILALPAEALPAIAELPGELRHMAEIMAPVIGDESLTVRAVVALAQEYRGASAYIHGMGAFFLKVRNQRIRAEYDRGGTSGPQLARRYRLSDRQIWNILGGADS
jgi:Mor family transcriptional regulator